MTGRLALLAFVIAALAGAGCERAQLGLPAVAIAASSPDHAVTAYVRNHPSLDPPNQSLWMRLSDGREVQLSKLSEDQDWSNAIVWSADSRRAAFLVQDSRVALADAATGRLLGWTFLVDDRRDYPTAEVVRDLALSADGSEATYRVCRRAGRTFGVTAAEADASCGPVVSRTLVLSAMFPPP